MAQILINEEDGQVYDTMAPDTGEFDAPYENLVFIAVQANPNIFCFLNALDNRMEFKWSRWNQFKSVLQPMTFHCFKVNGYKTKTGSGHGFTPVEHIAEFPGIHVARLYNAEYLSRWQEFNIQEAEEITKATRYFVKQMDGFQPVHSSILEVYAEQAQDHFDMPAHRELLSKLKTGWSVPTIDLNAIVDTGWLADNLALDLAD